MDSQPDGEGVEDFIAKYVVTIEKEATVKDGLANGQQEMQLFGRVAGGRRRRHRDRERPGP